MLREASLVIGVAALSGAARADVTVTGTVYADVDGDGLFSAADRPIPGAVVAWETWVFAETDADGQYALVAPRAGIVWVRTPDGFSPEPVWNDIDGAVGTATADLGLVPARAAGPARFAVGADSHVGVVPAERIGAALTQMTAIDPPLHFLTIVGDLTDNTIEDQFVAMRQSLAGLSVPFVPVPGNHDWFDGGPGYRAHFGPPMYSFDSGGVHFIVLNLSQSIDEQVAFVRADLARRVPAGTPVAAFLHNPPADHQAAALADAGVRFLFTGHFHSNRIIPRPGLLEVNTEALVWGGIDYTPAGYRIAQLVGEELVLTHHTLVSRPVIEPMYPRPDTCVPAGTSLLLAAVEIGAATPQVTLAVDGGAPVVMTPRGGWVFGAEVTVAAGAHAAHLEVPGVAARTFSFCGASALIPEPVTEWPELQGSPSHHGAVPETVAPPLRAAWARPLGGHLRGGSPILSGGRLFVPVVDLAGADAGGLVALDARTGDVLWETRGQTVQNSAAAAGRHVVFATADAVVRAHDVATGAELWRYDLGAGLSPLATWQYAAPSISDRRVYIALNRRLVALDLDLGTPLWTVDPVPPGQGVGTYAAVGVMPDRLVGALGRGDDGMFGLRPIDGHESWRKMLALPQTMHSSPVLAPEVAYLVDVDGQVIALDHGTGAMRWSRALYPPRPGAGILATPALAGGRLFIPTPAGAIYAIDAEAGYTLWQAPGGSSVINPVRYSFTAKGYLAAAAVSGEIVWAAGIDGILRGLDVATGEERARYDLGAPVLSGVVASGNTLYVGTYDGTLRALVHDPEPPPDIARGCRTGSGEPTPGSLALVVAVLAMLRRGRVRCAAGSEPGRSRSARRETA